MANVPKLTNPAARDRIIYSINDGLAERLPWLDNAYGVAQRIVSKGANQKTYALPNVWKGGLAYEPVSPDQENGNFVFWECRDPQTVQTFQGMPSRLSYNCSLILWYDCRKVVNGERNTEQVKQMVLEVLRSIPMRFTVERIYEEAANIYRGYTLDEIDNQYLTHPFAGLRIEGVLLVDVDCYPPPPPPPVFHTITYIIEDGQPESVTEQHRRGTTTTLKTPDELGVTLPDRLSFLGWEIDGEPVAEITLTGDVEVVALLKDEREYRNLWLNTRDMNLTNSAIWSYISNGANGSSERGTQHADGSTWLVFKGANSSGILPAQQNITPLEVGKKYTMSWIVRKASAASNLSFQPEAAISNSDPNYAIYVDGKPYVRGTNITIQTEFRVEIRFTYNGWSLATQRGGITISPTYVTIWARKPQLEIGEGATDWTPHKDD